MTDREKAIVMAYTGVVMLSGDKLDIFYQYVREKLGHCVMTHEMVFPEVQDAIADAAKNDFIELAKGNEAPTVGEWVSVKDRLPEKNGDYITYDRDGTVWPHFFTASSKVWEDALGFSTELVTHWMPLPEPPEEEWA